MRALRTGLLACRFFLGFSGERLVKTDFARPSCLVLGFSGERLAKTDFARPPRPTGLRGASVSCEADRGSGLRCFLGETKVQDFLTEPAGRDFREALDDPGSVFAAFTQNPCVASLTAKNQESSQYCACILKSKW